MSPIDHDGPPDGDFASYVERLSGNAGAPGRVEPPGRASKRRARALAAQLAAPAAGAPSRSLADEAREALRRTAAGARTGGAGPVTDALRANARATALRLSRGFAIGGIALIAAAVLELVPALTPLPGISLLFLSFILRRLASR
jgi:hypothetical protein